MASYRYKILRKVESPDDLPKGATLYVELEDQTAKTPDVAALAAAEGIGKTGSYRSISTRHFNEIPIVPTTGFAIGEPSEGDGAPIGEVDTGTGLAKGLDPAHLCETDECGHLPSEHGAKGLGICRVEGCPCGKYEPAP